MEYKVLIGDVEYGMENIESATIESPLFDQLSVGNACSAQLNISFWPTSAVPRMAKIIPYARENDASDWVQLGVFYTDERSMSAGGKMSIIAYDSMLMTEVIWEPEDESAFPMGMKTAVELIFEMMGVSLDERTSLTDDYVIDYPANDYTIRDVLGFIAAAHVGNWIVTAGNKFLLVPLFSSMPDETNRLVDENGDAITFGGVGIIV